MCVSTCVRAATSPEPEPRGSQVLRLAAAREGGAPKRARAPSRACQQKRAARLPSAAPGSIKEGGGQTKCCAWQHEGRGGPETRSGTVQSLKCCPCHSRNEPRGSQVLRLAASRRGGGGQTKCCAWQHQGRAGPETRSCCSRRLPSAAPGRREGGGPETRSGTVQSLKCCPCQQKQPRGSQVLRLAASRGGPETRSGTVQSLKCCPCQQKRAARLPSAETRSDTVQSLAPGSMKGGPKTRSCLPLPAETSREAPKCCAWQHQGRGGPNQVLPGSIKGGGGPETRSGPSRA